MGPPQCDIGLIGLAVMGQNLVLNMEDHGFRVAVFNRTVSKVDDFLRENPGKKLHGARSLEDLVRALSKPRKVMLMVKAGAPVDEFIEQLLPLLEKGDVIIDGGNSHFKDDVRRARDLMEKGIFYVDAGTSGGVWGLERGYCLMIGGEKEGVEKFEQAFTSLLKGLVETRAAMLARA